MSRLVCTLGDKSSHGGTIVTASGFGIDGVNIALEGDLCQCPIKGHGTCALIGSNPNITINGKMVIFTGDKTVCGAILTTGKSGFTSD